MPLPQTPPAPQLPPTPSDLAWRVIGLLNLYRLLVPLVLLAMQWLRRAGTGAGRPHGRSCSSRLHRLLHGRRCCSSSRGGCEWPSLRIVALVNAGVDARRRSDSFSMRAAGSRAAWGSCWCCRCGAGGARGPSRRLSDRRDRCAGSPRAAGLRRRHRRRPASDYSTAGVIGAVLFVIALSAWPVANRLRESEALVRRQEIDLANLAQLSQYIVQHLRESILVVDTQDRIRLINESAAADAGRQQRLSRTRCSARPRRGCCTCWRPGASGTRRGRDRRSGPDVRRRRRRARHPRRTSRRWAPRSPRRCWCFWRTRACIAEKVQQSKLAALGRLTASIAHEIRNPVGAMSHAGQLLAESPNLGRRGSAPDRDHPQQRRARQRHHRQRPAALAARGDAASSACRCRPGREEFQRGVLRTMQCAASAAARSSGASADVEVRVDPEPAAPDRLESVRERAQARASRDDAEQSVELRYGRMSGTARPFLEVADRGPGVDAGARRADLRAVLQRRAAAPDSACSSRASWRRPMARRCCTSRATGGGSIFRLVFADPRRWEV